MKPDGTDVKRLAGVTSAYARYSPNGRKIVYMSGKFPETKIMVADADGSNAVNITPQK